MRLLLVVPQIGPQRLVLTVRLYVIVAAASFAGGDRHRRLCASANHGITADAYAVVTLQLPVRAVCADAVLMLQFPFRSRRRFLHRLSGLGYISKGRNLVRFDWKKRQRSQVREFARRKEYPFFSDAPAEGALCAPMYVRGARALPDSRHITRGQGTNSNGGSPCIPPSCRS